MSRDVVNAGAPAIGAYSDAVRAGGLLLLSGRIGLEEGRLVDGVGPQTAKALSNAAEVLAAANLSMDNVARCTFYLSDMSDFAAMDREYAKAFSAPPPARSTVAVAGLPMGALVEIELTAAIRP